ncbi:uncharacterized protein LOC135153862 [Lytechinus pictus]|uniref:uncharacterized protein LOC135153862 n=1 Tax=Lytechinus pictus TaxID=7653 RepID=UPI0030B9F2AA
MASRMDRWFNIFLPSLQTELLFFVSAMLTLSLVKLGSASDVDSIERMTLIADEAGNIPFELHWDIDESLEVHPYFTIHLNSLERPFNVNGQNDPLGFMSESQAMRFTVTKTDSRRGFIAVNIHITNVQISDAAVYIFKLILFDHPHNFHRTLRKEVEVFIPRGRATCKIRNSAYSSHLREVHCKADTRGHNTTITCFQNGMKAPYKCRHQKSNQHDMSHTHTHRTFWLSKFGDVSCCSHETKVNVNESTCVDFRGNYQSYEKPVSSSRPSMVPEISFDPTSMKPYLAPTDSGCSKHDVNFIFESFLLVATIYILHVSTCSHSCVIT